MGYHNIRTGEVQWEFPDLPHHWQAITDPDTSHIYYHNTRTNQTLWDPPEVEELDRPVHDLEVSSVPANRAERSDVTIWRRSFLDDHAALHSMKEALAAALRSA